MTDIGLVEVAERLPREGHLLIAAHENPDGDALGCVVALMLMAERLGVPHIAYIPGEGAFPPELSFLPLLDRIRRGPFPVVDAGTTAYILDCASSGRLDPQGLSCVGLCINIDHHQDNTRFGGANLVDVTATSSTQLLYNIFRAGGLPLDADIGTALYVGLVTDSGRFQYTNTTPAAHRMAAELQELGVDVNAVYRDVYESQPLAKVRLLQRALERMSVHLEGRLVLSYLCMADLEELGAEEALTEGIIDTLRTVEGAGIAALLRERSRDGVREYKGSLRSTERSIDVAAIAHVWSGGGHRQAAGFTAHGELSEIVGRLLEEAAARL